MKILSSWLREFANPNVTDEELAEKLTMAGLEIDNINTIAPKFNEVVVGEVVECIKHPNADKLSLCQVNIESEVLQIICGAKNIRVGLKVCVAKSGAILPGNFKIKKAKLRGIESNGMICSENEIGLTDESEMIMELDNSLTVGANIRNALNLDDTIMELDITPNRGDCFSLLGVAREVAANYNLSLQKLNYNNKIMSDLTLNSSVKNNDYCAKYLTRVIADVDNNVATPKWMVNKLTACGFALNSAIVDITNFVLLELGQPLHAFDMEKIDGNICVRLANAGEKITLLNDQEIALKNNTLIIADNNKALAVAGIMGGIDAKTQTETTNIILESAFFDNNLIAGKARDYGLHTESSLRFERGVDFENTEFALERATNLIIDICGGKAGAINSQIDAKNLPQINPITLSYAKIIKVLGFELDKAWIIEKFKALSFEITSSNDTYITIIPPSFRFDIRIQADLIEELARLYGYDKLPAKSLDLNVELKNNDNKYRFSNVLVGRNYNEVVTYSFISQEMSDIVGGSQIKLKNAISADMSIMRSSIIAGLLKVAVDNNSRGINNLRIFEQGLCFNGFSANEQVAKIAGLITGKYQNSWNSAKREVDFFDLKSDVLALFNDDKVEFVESDNKLLQYGQSANIIYNNQAIGIIGSLNPIAQKQLSLNKCFVFEVNLSSLLVKNKIKYKNLSNYQSSSRDISILVDNNITYSAIEQDICNLKQEYLTNIELLDVWNGEEIDKNKQSLTFRLFYQANDKTLTVNEIEASTAEILELLIKKYNITQR